MSFITSPNNVEYLIPDVRLRIGDLDGTRYSNTIVRSAIVGGIKYLQARWVNRYMVYTDETLVSPQPADVPANYIYATTPVGNYLIPSGLVPGDIYRNPTATFADTSAAVIAQIDETPIIAAAVMVLSRTQLASSAASFVNWSDGEYSYSNVSSSNILAKLYADSLSELNAYFKTSRAKPMRDNLPTMLF